MNGAEWKTRQRWLTAFVAAVSMSALVAACGGQGGDPETDHGAEEIQPATEHEHHEGEELEVVELTPAEIEEAGIVLDTAGPGDMRIEKVLPGTVGTNQDRHAHIVPRVGGIVRSVRSNLGDVVRPGQVMAILESRELGEIKADYLADRERLELQQSNFEREERLLQQRISSQLEYLTAHQALTEARIALRLSTQKLLSLGFTEDSIEQLPELTAASLVDYPLIATIGGTVVAKYIEQGEAVTAEAQAFLVVDLTTVWIDLDIYQQDLGLIREGQQVVVSEASGLLEASGVISYVRPLLGEDTRTSIARVVLSNPDGLWRPGMFVSGVVSVDAHRVPVLIRTAAVQKINDKAVVFARTEAGFEPREIVVGAENRMFVAVASGLEAGEEYVVEGAFALKSHLAAATLEAGHVH